MAAVGAALEEAVVDRKGRGERRRKSRRNTHDDEGSGEKPLSRVLGWNARDRKEVEGGERGVGEGDVFEVG